MKQLTDKEIEQKIKESSKDFYKQLDDLVNQFKRKDTERAEKNRDDRD